MAIKNRFVYIGDVALDEYYSIDRWPAMNDKLMVKTLPAIPGGMIANATCVSAAMGKDVSFIAALNSGAVTQLLLRDLETYGIDTSYVSFDESLPDSKTMIFMLGDQNTIFIPELNIDHIELSGEALEYLSDAEIVYSSPGELSTLRCGDMGWKEIIEYCRKKGALFCCDLDVYYAEDLDQSFFENTDILFFNEIGYERFCRGRSDAEGYAALRDMGNRIVVVTKAEKGCDVYADGVSTHYPAAAIDVVDATGAGDTFCSSFLVAYSDTGDIAYSAKYATAAASICCINMGAREGAVSKEKVMEYMDSMTYNIL